MVGPGLTCLTVTAPFLHSFMIEPRGLRTSKPPSSSLKCWNFWNLLTKWVAFSPEEVSLSVTKLGFFFVKLWACRIKSSELRSEISPIPLVRSMDDISLFLFSSASSVSKILASSCTFSAWVKPSLVVEEKSSWSLDNFWAFSATTFLL